MFFEDAKLVSEELDLTLTGKDYGRNERAPMCGIPYHSCEMYISRLVSKGYKIAICDQIEAANDVKGLVKREVVRVITPGTVIEGSMLDESKNNYKKLSLKIGKLIFQNEEYEREIKNLKEKITQLEQENNKLKNIQKENKWNLKSLINK